MERRQYLGPGFVGVKFDIVADGVGGKEAIDRAGDQEVFVDDVVEELPGVVEELLGLRVLQDRWIASAQLPGVKEGGPVYEGDQGGKRKAEGGRRPAFARSFGAASRGRGGRRGVGGEEADAGELGLRKVVWGPGDGRPTAAGFFEAEQRLDFALGLLVVAPPMSNGTVKPWRSISEATWAISSSDGVINPLKPIMSAFLSRAVCRIFSQGVITPRSMTS